MSFKIKLFYQEHNKLINIFLFIISLPFVLVFINYFSETLYNLGTYFGTFLRHLYDIVVY